MKGPKNLLTADIIGLAAVGSLTAVVYLAGVSPMLQKADAEVAQRATLSEQEQAVTAKSQDLRDAKARLAAIEEERSRSVHLYPASMRNDKVRRLSELAAEVKVTVTEITPRDTIKGDRVSRVPITLAGTSEAPAFQEFLRRLHAEFPDTHVVSFNIADIPESLDSPATFSAELIWFTIGERAAQSGREGGAAGEK